MGSHVGQIKHNIEIIGPKLVLNKYSASETVMVRHALNKEIQSCFMNMNIPQSSNTWGEMVSARLKCLSDNVTFFYKEECKGLQTLQ